VPQIFDADASPEKKLFISLITRDISLSDAIIDLLDNSVNAAMRPIKNSFSSANDFHKLFVKASVQPEVTVRVTFDRDQVTVVDDAAGIDFDSAYHEVFRFGHSEVHDAPRDRLSVYGIGMKRALFKIGRQISITSNHKSGGFGLTLNVRRWAKDTALPWTIPIAKRDPAVKTGTTISISDLNPEIRERLSEKTFEHNLIEKLSKVYSFFIGRIVNIYINAKLVPRTEFDIGEDNLSHDRFKRDGVDCSILAGIASPTSGRFESAAAGWFVFCNYRTVLYGDKSPLTGWGGALPLFQPKHRPFLGIVLFTAADPEALPWTTTKGYINEDNRAWQEAKLKMAAAAKPVISFLDKRYTNDGTEILPSGIAKLAGEGVNVFEAAVAAKSTFVAPVAKKKKASTTKKVQYDAEESELNKIRKYFGRSNMSASEIGRVTFDHFLRKVVVER